MAPFDAPADEPEDHEPDTALHPDEAEQENPSDEQDEDYPCGAADAPHARQAEDDDHRAGAEDDGEADVASPFDAFDGFNFKEPADLFKTDQDSEDDSGDEASRFGIGLLDFSQQDGDDFGVLPGGEATNPDSDSQGSAREGFLQGLQDGIDGGEEGGTTTPGDDEWLAGGEPDSQTEWGAGDADEAQNLVQGPDEEGADEIDEADGGHFSPADDPDAIFGREGDGDVEDSSGGVAADDSETRLGEEGGAGNDTDSPIGADSPLAGAFQDSFNSNDDLGGDLPQSLFSSEGDDQGSFLSGLFGQGPPELDLGQEGFAGSGLPASDEERQEVVPEGGSSATGEDAGKAEQGGASGEGEQPEPVGPSASEVPGVMSGGAIPDFGFGALPILAGEGEAGAAATDEAGEPGGFAPGLPATALPGMGMGLPPTLLGQVSTAVPAGGSAAPAGSKTEAAEQEGPEAKGNPKAPEPAGDNPGGAKGAELPEWNPPLPPQTKEEKAAEGEKRGQQIEASGKGMDVFKQMYDRLDKAPVFEADARQQKAAAEHRAAQKELDATTQRADDIKQKDLDGLRQEAQQDVDRSYSDLADAREQSQEARQNQTEAQQKLQQEKAAAGNSGGTAAKRVDRAEGRVQEANRQVNQAEAALQQRQQDLKDDVNRLGQVQDAIKDEGLDPNKPVAQQVAQQVADAQAKEQRTQAEAQDTKAKTQQAMDDVDARGRGIGTKVTGYAGGAFNALGGINSLRQNWNEEDKVVQLRADGVKLGADLGSVASDAVGDAGKVASKLDDVPVVGGLVRGLRSPAAGPGLGALGGAAAIFKGAADYSGAADQSAEQAAARGTMVSGGIDIAKAGAAGAGMLAQKGVLTGAVGSVASTMGRVAAGPIGWVATGYQAVDAAVGGEVTDGLWHFASGTVAGAYKAVTGDTEGAKQAFQERDANVQQDIQQGQQNLKNNLDALQNFARDPVGSIMGMVNGGQNQEGSPGSTPAGPTDASAPPQIPAPVAPAPTPGTQSTSTTPSAPPAPASPPPQTPAPAAPQSVTPVPQTSTPQVSSKAAPPNSNSQK